MCVVIPGNFFLWVFGRFKSEPKPLVRPCLPRRDRRYSGSSSHWASSFWEKSSFGCFWGSGSATLLRCNYNPWKFKLNVFKVKLNDMLEHFESETNFISDINRVYGEIITE